MEAVDGSSPAALLGPPQAPRRGRRSALAVLALLAGAVYVSVRAAAPSVGAALLQLSSAAPVATRASSLAPQRLPQHSDLPVARQACRAPAARMDAAAPKVTVVGGSGFVGSRVCKLLVERGADVSAVSQSGGPPEWCANADWAKVVRWASNDLCRGSRESLAEAVGSPDVLVSCVGAVGFDRQGLRLGNGVANAELARVAKAIGAERFVYVSVASDVSRAKGWLPDFFAGYFEGKEMAEAAITDAVGADNAYLVKPSFIYGGEDFGLTPPRVAAWYGAGIEELLSTGAFRFLADKLPGLLKVALRPPVSVDAVAAACAAAAFGEPAEQVIDGTDKINAAAGAKTPDGVAKWFKAQALGGPGLVSEDGASKPANEGAAATDAGEAGENFDPRIILYVGFPALVLGLQLYFTFARDFMSGQNLGPAVMDVVDSTGRVIEGVQSPF